MSTGGSCSVMNKSTLLKKKQIIKIVLRSIIIQVSINDTYRSQQNFVRAAVVENKITFWPIRTRTLAVVWYKTYYIFIVFTHYVYKYELSKWKKKKIQTLLLGLKLLRPGVWLILLPMLPHPVEDDELLCYNSGLKNEQCSSQLKCLRTPCLSLLCLLFI